MLQGTLESGSLILEPFPFLVLFYTKFGVS
jgi:hypothetical protein